VCREWEAGKMGGEVVGVKRGMNGVPGAGDGELKV
jgi:hypothetical protein